MDVPGTARILERKPEGPDVVAQSFGQMMRNQIYVGKIGSPDYGVSLRGDFEALVYEATFYRAQAVLDGRVIVAGPRQRNHPDFRCVVSCVATSAAGPFDQLPVTIASASAER